MSGEPIYIIDSSSLIAAWNELYPPEHFPAFWKHIEALIGSHRLHAPEEVISEIGRKANDGLGNWAQNQDGFEVPIDEHQERHVAAILISHPKLVDTMAGRSEGDPWVIALAMAYEGCVITQETAFGTQKRPRIPNVCAAMGVPCKNILGVIRAENWRVG